MGWKEYKQLFQNQKPSEAQFILGIDLGSASSSISYYDYVKKGPELIDVSGGYGKPSVPSVMQFIPETGEWVYGEYALLNQGGGTEITFSALMDRMGRYEYIEVDNKPVPVSQIFGLYIKELIGNVQNLNPKAEIAGIVVAIGNYISKEVEDEILQSFEHAGFKDKIISFVSDTECILARYFFNKNVQDENVLILDYGSRHIRGGVYQISTNKTHSSIKSLSYGFQEALGTREIDRKMKHLLTGFYCQDNGKLPEKLPRHLQKQLGAFAYQHKDLLLQKKINDKPAKLYYNFVYPPYQKAVHQEEIDALLQPFQEIFGNYIQEIMDKNIYNLDHRLTPGDIGSVVAVGGGFEMLWPRLLLDGLFPHSNLVFYKNAKGAVSQGACLLAARELGITDMEKIELEDFHQLQVDLGVQVSMGAKEKFVPIMEKHSFWSGRTGSKIFILNSETQKDVEIELYKRDESGYVHKVTKFILDNFPKRPKGCGRVAIGIQFHQYDMFTATVEDLGFGELFPKTDYKKVFPEIQIGQR